MDSGDFSFDLWVACSPSFEHGNFLGDPYTEIEGLGFISNVAYHGPEFEVSVEEYLGVEPYVAATGGEYEPIEKGMTFGELQGLQFPSGIIPDFSQEDTRLRYVFKVKTTNGALAGAALAFTLQREAGGYRPVDIRVEPLAEEELETITYDPAASPPFPTKDVESVYPELKEMRALLNRWQTPLLSEPGWLHQVTPGRVRWERHLREPDRMGDRRMVADR